MKVAIIGSVGVPSKYGGFETLTHQLVDYLSENIELTVYCSSQQYISRPSRYKNAKLEYIPLNANGIQSIPYDIISIFKAFRKNDILLILGVAGVIVLPLIKLLSKSKIIIHIDGMEWKREKWKSYAKLYLKYSERLALNISDAIIADNSSILDNIDKKYIKKTSLITYGGDHAQSKSLPRELLSRLDIGFDEYAFSVCRIVPENNIKTILKAFKKTEQALVFVGNWSGSVYGLSLLQEFDQVPNIKLINPIYNQIELDALRSNCRLYVHGHSAGGTNPSLVEALCLGLNIVCFDVSFNRVTMKEYGSYFKNQKELEEIIENPNISNKLPEEILDYAYKNYKWENIANDYLNLFKQVV